MHAVTSGTQTLKDATNEAFRVWAERVDDTFYVIGSVVGAHPYPYMVRELQKVIGVEARRQVLERFGRLPSDVVACVGGGSNAMGIFSGFVDDPEVKLWGVEAGGDGIESGGRPRRWSGKHRRAARFALVPVAEREGQVRDDALDQRGSRLSGRRPRARVF